MRAEIRPATRADLPAAVAVAYRWDVRDDPSPPPAPSASLLAHVLATGQVFVAERAGAIVGFSASITRGPIAFLTDLFVEADEQSSGIGRALLTAALPEGMAPIRCTLSSADPRAQALYVRAGMRPWWPAFWLRGRANALGALPESELSVREAEARDPELLEWDAASGGRRRPEDFAHWQTEAAAAPLWLERSGTRVGYAVVQRRSLASIRFPESYAVGPVGARSQADAAASVLAAVSWTCQRAKVVRVALAGPHPALKPLLDAGFKIVDVDMFCSSADAAFFDPCRYVMSGDYLL